MPNVHYNKFITKIFNNVQSATPKQVFNALDDARSRLVIKTALCYASLMTKFVFQRLSTINLQVCFNVTA